MKKIYFLLWIVIVSAAGMQAQNRAATSASADANRIADDAVAYILKGDNNKLIELLGKCAIYPEDIANKNNAFIDFLNSNNKNYGQLKDIELGVEETLGNHIVAYTYVMLYEQRPVWLRFSFYSSNEAFKLFDWHWGEDVLNKLDD